MPGLHRARVLIAFLLLAVVPKAGNAAPAPKRKQGRKVEDLATTVARRLSRRLHAPVRLAELSYRIFQAAFVGKGLRVGPPAAPYLEAAELRVELAGFDNRRALRDVVASGVTGRIPLAWLERPIRARGASVLSVRRVKLRRAALWLMKKGEAVFRLIGVKVDGESLAFRTSAKGVVTQLSGALRITARSLILGEVKGQAFELALKFSPRRVSVERLALGLFGGRVVLKGGITVGRRPRIDLRGSASLRPWGTKGPTLAGKLRVRSSAKGGVDLTGALKSVGGGRGAAPTASGALPGGVPLRLNVHLGKRRLAGSLRRWRIR